MRWVLVGCLGLFALFCGAGLAVLFLTSRADEHSAGPELAGAPPAPLPFHPERDPAGERKRSALGARKAPSTGTKPIVLAPDERRTEVSGTVRDARDQRPIKGASVEFMARDGGDIAHATTGADGAYRIRVARSVPERIDILVTAQGYAAHYQPCPFVLEAGSPRTWNVELQPAFSLTGNVVDGEDGSQVEDASVTLKSMNPTFADAWEDATTGEDGSFAFEALDGLPRKDLLLLVEADDFQPLLVGNITGDPLEVRMHVEAVLARATHMSGKVVDAQSRQPIPGAELMAISNDSEFPTDEEWIACDSGGRFELEVGEQPASAVRWIGRARGYGPNCYSSWAGAELELELYPLFHLRGALVDAEDGAPIGGAALELVPEDCPLDLAEEWTASAESAKNGNFEISLASVPLYSWSRLCIRAPGYLPREERVFPTPGKFREELRLSLFRAVHIHGRVLSSGAPVKAAEVSSHVEFEPELDGVDLGPDLGGTTTTDRDGRFELIVPIRGLERGVLVVESSSRTFAFRMPLIAGDSHATVEVELVLSHR